MNAKTTRRPYCAVRVYCGSADCRQIRPCPCDFLLAYLVFQDSTRRGVSPKSERRSSVTAQYFGSIDNLRYNRFMLNTQVEKTCTICGNTYKVKLYRAPASKFCSKECWERRNEPETKNCAHCGESFTVYKSLNQKYCSKSCARSDTNGRHGNAWKGGKTRAVLVTRQKKQYREWRAAVLARDGHKCTDCGSISDLHVHHIKSFDKFPESRYDIDNGKTVCESCHSRIHGRPVSLSFRRQSKQT